MIVVARVSPLALASSVTLVGKGAAAAAAAEVD